MTTSIDNFPGYPEGVSGFDLMADLKKQAERFNTEIRNNEITKVDFSHRPFTLNTDNGDEIKADSVIISTGASARWLGLESEEKFKGQGVSACATCDGFFYKKQDVAVVGGGDTACGEAMYLSNICNKVYLIVRRDELRASVAVKEMVMKNAKIEILWKNKPVEVLGDENGVNGVRIESTLNGERKDIKVTGLFVAIGHTPNTDIFKGQLELNEEGYIITNGATSYTSVEGVFAAGDVQDIRYRQAITAAGSGCKAAIDCERYLIENPLD
jgi:thioredoxin reductase (NADPH)